MYCFQLHLIFIISTHGWSPEKDCPCRGVSLQQCTAICTLHLHTRGFLSSQYIPLLHKHIHNILLHALYFSRTAYYYYWKDKDCCIYMLRRRDSSRLTQNHVIIHNLQRAQSLYHVLLLQLQLFHTQPVQCSESNH